MKDAGTLKLTTLGDREIVMTRVFDAPRRLVFDALTKPELVKQWLLGPPGWTMPVCEIDLRVGGAYRYLLRRHSDATEMGMRGVHGEIVVPERLVATEKFAKPRSRSRCATSRGRPATLFSSPAWSAAWLRATIGLRSCWNR